MRKGLSDLETANINNFASALNVNSVTDLIFTLKKSGYRPDQATQALIDEYRKKKVYCDSSGLNNHGLITELDRSLIKSAELSNANLFRHFYGIKPCTSIF